MGRARKFFHAIWSGYLVIGATSILNFITIPIALAAIGEVDFGLWSAVAQVALLTNLLDLGVGPSLARFIAEFKDDSRSPAYATFVKSVLAVGVVQGLVFTALAFGLLPLAPDFIGIKPEQAAAFKRLLAWQLGITALGFPFRLFGQMLSARQEIARLNVCTLVAVLVNATLLIIGLGAGWGVYSYVVASGGMFIVMQAALLYHVLRLDLIPDLRAARVSFTALKPLAAYSLNVFFIVGGIQLVSFIPTVIVTRHLGVEALTAWTIGTRLIFLAWQLIGRMPNASEPAFWEMFTHGESARLRERLGELVLLCGAAAAFMGAGIAAVNEPFVHLWTSGKIVWTTLNDACFSIWLPVTAVMWCLNMTPGITKRLGHMKYVYLAEGGALAVLAYAPLIRLHSLWQVTVALTLATCLFRLPYGIMRTGHDLAMPRSRLAAIFSRVFGVAVVLLLLALAIHAGTRGLSPWIQLCVSVLAYGVVATPVVYRFGLPREPRDRARQALVTRWRKLSGTSERPVIPKPPSKDLDTGPR